MSQPITLTADAPEYVGKHLLVGITHESHEGEFMYQEQFHGDILEAGPGGVVIRRNDNGHRISLPPQLSPASPGAYRLRSTGEVVEDPDYLATWVIREGAGEEKPAST